jgi:hypothetical protein
MRRGFNANRFRSPFRDSCACLVRHPYASADLQSKSRWIADRIMNDSNTGYSVANSISLMEQDFFMVEFLLQTAHDGVADFITVAQGYHGLSLFCDHRQAGAQMCGRGR